MNILCPKAMEPEVLQRENFEPLDFETLKGLFSAYRIRDMQRSQLIEAIHDWQVTEAWREIENERSLSS